MVNVLNYLNKITYVQNKYICKGEKYIGGKILDIVRTQIPAKKKNNKSMNLEERTIQPSEFEFTIVKRPWTGPVLFSCHGHCC